MKSKIHIIFAFLFILSIVPFLGKFTSSVNVNEAKNELFRPELFYCNSVDKALIYTDSVYKGYNSTVFDTSLYVQTVSKFCKERFYHNLSHYSISDNWIACIAGKLIWSHLSAIVIPDDILKHSGGLCSQQTIVFMELLKRKGINVRTVGLGYKEGPGHFLCEVHYNGGWRLHDVTMEPRWNRIENIHKSLDYYLQNKDSLFLAYEGRLDRKLFNKLMEKTQIGSINETTDKKMLLFHQFTAALTYLLPLFFLLMSILSYVKLKKLKRQS